MILHPPILCSLAHAVRQVSSLSRPRAAADSTVKMVTNGPGVLFERLNAHVKCWHTFRSNTCLDPAVGTVFKHLPMLLLAHC